MEMKTNLIFAKKKKPLFFPALSNINYKLVTLDENSVQK